ncbi:hypothetical protein [Serinibacter arcticus]|uniref:hypothetical protein n=1 Tax=Serinibacter arcticus TaxID=1655435 RepID=UPI001092B1C5|nr:hypothetical protein [Serinibacter arcticus]
MQRRRGAAAAGLLALAVATAAACSPRVDPEDAAAWFAEVETNGPPGFVGGGPTSTPVEAPRGTDLGVLVPTVTQDLAAPLDIATIDAMCFGGGMVSIAISVSTPEAERSSLIDIPCDGERHEVAPARDGVTSFAFGGYPARWGPTYYAVVVDEA